MLSILLLVLIVILLLGALPAWPYSRSWGYYPSGGIGLVLVIILVLVLMGHLSGEPLTCTPAADGPFARLRAGVHGTA